MSKHARAARVAAQKPHDRSTPDWVIISAQLPPALYRALVIRATDERSPRRDVIRRALEAYFETPLRDAAGPGARARRSA